VKCCIQILSRQISEIPIQSNYYMYSTFFLKSSLWEAVVFLFLNFFIVPISVIYFLPKILLQFLSVIFITIFFMSE